MDSELDFCFEQAISRQEDDRNRLLEFQGLLHGQQFGQTAIVGRGRKVVCRHWLRGMCWKGELCEFLHQYDTSRMPICRQFQKTGRCADYESGSCVFFHDVNSNTNNNKLDGVTDGPPCIHYYLGFCRSGPKCRNRHQRLDKDVLPPLVPDWYLRLIIENSSSVIPPSLDPETETVMEQVERVCRELVGAGYTSGTTVPTETVVPTSETSIGDHKPGVGDATTAHESERSSSSFIKHVSKRSSAVTTIDENIISRAKTEGIPRLPHVHRSGTDTDPPRVRIFMIKSSDLKNIYKSIRLGVWATGKQNTSLLDQAYKKCDHVVLLFSANESGGFQGYGRMASSPVSRLHPNLWGSFSSRLGPNFRVQWLKQCKVEFEKFGGLTNPLNDDQPIRKSRDCQEIPLALAQVICTIIDQSPDEDLLATTDEATLPRIAHHSNFFQLTEEQQFSIERSIGISHDHPVVSHPPKVLSNYDKRHSYPKSSNSRTAPY